MATRSRVDTVLALALASLSCGTNYTPRIAGIYLRSVTLDANLRRHARSWAIRFKLLLHGRPKLIQLPFQKRRSEPIHRFRTIVLLIGENGCSRESKCLATQVL